MNLATRTVVVRYEISPGNEITLHATEPAERIHELRALMGTTPGPGVPALFALNESLVRRDDSEKPARRTLQIARIIELQADPGPAPTPAASLLDHVKSRLNTIRELEAAKEWPEAAEQERHMYADLLRDLAAHLPADVAAVVTVALTDN